LRGTYLPAFCCRWTWHRCQGKPPSTDRRATPRPAWSLLITNLTPLIPRGVVSVNSS
jgi:hypothetical protein